MHLSLLQGPCAKLKANTNQHVVLVAYNVLHLKGFAGVFSSSGDPEKFATVRVRNNRISGNGPYKHNDVASSMFCVLSGNNSTAAP